MSTVLLALAGFLFAGHLVTVLLAWPRRARPPAHAGVPPPVTLLRPVCGVDGFDELTLRSSFTQDHPDYRIIFCAPSPSDPAVALVTRLMAEYPHVPARLLTGEAAGLRNPKLRNVWKGWQAAEDEMIAMTDSNLLLPSDYLSALCASWGPGTGMVSSPPVGIWPRDMGGRLECAFLNGNQARLQLAVARLGHGFAQGKTLFFHRPLIEAEGGLKALDRHLAEDVNATKLVRGLGLKVTPTPRLYAQPIGKRNLRQVLARQLRWAQVRREGFAPLFAAEPLNGAAVPLLLCLAGSLAAGLGVTPAAAMAVLWYGAEAALMRAHGWPASWRDVALLPLRDALMPAIWVAALGKRRFVWRGTTVDTAAAALAPLAAPDGTPAGQH